MVGCNLSWLGVRQYVRRVRSSLIGKVGIVASGTFASQLISMVTTPIVTRLFPAEQYGVMALFSSATSILGKVECLDYERAILIIEQDEDAWRMLRLCVYILLALTGIVLTACCVFDEAWFVFFRIANLFPYRFVIPLGFLAIGIYNILLQWIYRRRDYAIVPVTRFIQSISGSAVKIISGFFAVGPIGLIAGNIANEAAGLSVMASKLRRDMERLGAAEDGSLSYRTLLKKYYKFPCFSLPADFIDNFCNNLPVIMLASMYGAEDGGYYGLANSIISIPVALVISSMSSVIQAEAAAIGKENPKEIRRLCFKATKGAAIVIALPCFVLALWGPDLFALVFGKQWWTAGEYARLMIGRVAAFSVVVPIARMLELFGFQQFDFILNIGRLLCMVLSIYGIGLWGVDSYWAVFIWNTINMMDFVFLYVLIIWCVNRHIGAASEE